MPKQKLVLNAFPIKILIILWPIQLGAKHIYIYHYRDDYKKKAFQVNVL